MGIVKFATTHIPKQCPDYSLKGVHPDWEMHPSWIAGIEALDSYNHWVAEVVMPIAFQWIEEHKPEVYANIPEDLKDDVGVVIAAAFELIKGMSSYQKGLVKYDEYEKALKDGTWNTASINPVWTAIVQDVREATKDSFDVHEAVLKDTIR
jgi:hypothetical protein